MNALTRPRHAMPPDIEAALLDGDLMEAYRARPAYQQNDYLGWIERARRADTRERRLTHMLAELAAGHGYMNLQWWPRGVGSRDRSAPGREPTHTMRRLADRPLVEVAGRAEWRAWLQCNHSTSPGVWLAVGKKGNSRTALTYEEAVEEALCFGWIDSVVNRLDADRFKQSFTPRKRRSAWARTNKDRVERLAAQRLMTDAGLAAVEAAKADGSWQAFDDAQEIREHLWRWERRHPEWHPGPFGATVASYLIRVDDATLLIDPLVDDEHDPVLDELDRIVHGPVRILITIPYHTRSAELLWHRYRTHDARILGHELVRRRLHDSSGFYPLVGGENVDGMAHIHRIGRPVRAEIPIEVPSQRALIFGDAVIETDGQLRVWEAPLTGERRQRWYAERLLPTLRVLAESDPERILVTHGRAVLRAGRRELESALAREPWQPGAN